MAAVCGDDAVNGDCANGRSVAQQLSTMPDWLYEEEAKAEYKYDRFNHLGLTSTRVVGLFNVSIHTET
jgi:hypothetical protein